MTRPSRSGGWPGVIEAYREFLPVTPAMPVVTLLEGGTPFSRRPGSPNGSEPRVFLKLEGAQSDRLVQGPRHDARDLEGARRRGEGGCLRVDREHVRLRRRVRGASRADDARCSSPRATSRSASSLRRSSTARRCCRSAGTSTRRSTIVRALGDKAPVTVVNSVNPHRIEGQKTGAFEIVDALGDAPDCALHPRRQRREHHRLLEGILRVPGRRAGRRGFRRMLGFQAAGAAPIVDGQARREPRDRRYRDPDREPGLVVRRDRRGKRVGWGHPRGHRRGDPRGLPVPRLRGVGLLRGGVRGVGGRAAQVRRSRRFDGGVCPDRPRTEGSGPRHQPDHGPVGGGRRPSECVADALGL